MSDKGKKKNSDNVEGGKKKEKGTGAEGYNDILELEELEAALEIMQELGLKSISELENEIERRHALLDEDK